MSDTKRMDFVDVAKGVGVLLVILGHIIALNSYAENIIYSFHMPFFFLVSGMFANADRYKFFPYICRKFKQLFIPYIVIYIIGALVTYIIPVFDKFSVKDFFYGFFFDPHMNVGAIWFLPCLFFVNVFFYALYWLILSKNCFIINFIFILGFIISPELLITLKYFLGMSQKVYLPFKMEVALSSLAIYSIGFLFKKQFLELQNLPKKRYERIILPLLCLGVILVIPAFTGLIAVVNNSYGTDNMMYLLCAISGSAFLLCLGTFWKSSKLLKFIGKNSLFIFGFHFIFINLYSLLLTYIYGYLIQSQRNLNWWQIIVGFVSISMIMVVLAMIYVTVKKKILEKVTKNKQMTN